MVGATAAADPTAAAASPETTAKAWGLLEAELLRLTTAPSSTAGAAAGEDDASLLRSVCARGPALLADLRDRLESAEGRAAQRAEARAVALAAAQERKERAKALLAQIREEEAAAASVDPAARAKAAAAAEARAARAARLHRLEEEREYLGQLQQAMGLASQGGQAFSRETQTTAAEGAEGEEEEDVGMADARSMLLEALEGLAARRSEAFPELDRYVCQAGAELVAKAHGRWMAQLREGLEACGWPPTMGSRGGRRQGEGEDDDGEGGGGDTVAKFNGRVLGLMRAVLRLQAATLRFQFPAGLVELPGAGAPLWVSEELSLPVLERFAFHFEGQGGGKRANAAADRPDWAFEWLLRALRLSTPALTGPALEACVQEAFPALPQALPHPLLAFFARDLALAARRKVRAVLVDGSWTDDLALRGLAEAALQFDRALDEEAGYHRAAAATAALAASEGAKGRKPGGTLPALLAGAQSKWPRAAEVLVAPPERLERWAGVDGAWITAALDAACDAPGAWESEAAAEQCAAPVPAAQAFAGLVAALMERYQPLRDAWALRVLIGQTLKPLVRGYLSRLYDAAKGCRVSRALAAAGFEPAFRRYCLVVTATQLGLEAVEDASGDVVILRLEGPSSSGAAAASSPKAGSGLGAASSLVAGASSLIAAAVGSSETAAAVGSAALRTATATTETLSRAVEESGSIIGPTRILKKALGSIRDVVGTPTKEQQQQRETGARGSPRGTASSTATVPASPSAAAAASSSPPRPSAGGGAGVPPSTPSGPGSPRVGRGESNGLDVAAMLMDDTAAASGSSSSSSSSVLGFELLHLRSFRDGMLEDALAAVSAGFHARAHDYLTLLPPARVPTGEPSPALLPALAFLDGVLRAAAGSLERGALLRLWQGLCYEVAQSYAKRVRAIRAVGEGGGQQLVLDVEALAKVLTRPAPMPLSMRAGGYASAAALVMRPDNYLKALREAVGLLAWPGKQLNSLYDFLGKMLEDDEDVGGGAGEPQRGSSGAGSAAAQVQWALEAKGLSALSPEEVLALVEARRRGDRIQHKGASPSPRSPSA